MIKWLIKILGGYTQEEIMKQVRHANRAECQLLRLKNKYYRPRDPTTGRFIKK